MNYFKKAFKLIDNYVIARIQKRPSTALFWYLPEPPRIKTENDFVQYQQANKATPLYLIDYQKKLNYSLQNNQGIIVLPYDQPIGEQINPEAAFQYALGLHDQACLTQDKNLLKKFFNYADYFLAKQTKDGLWEYNFNWFNSAAPWSSALAQARGASVMLRAGLQTNNSIYTDAAKHALQKFLVATSDGGFMHSFSPANCYYFEEYPQTPTGVINGFMAALISIWELNTWLPELWLTNLWQQGVDSLEKMLPYYSTGWWSLYDLDIESPIKNVNSPRYHLLEIHYLQILRLLSKSAILTKEYELRVKQYNNLYFRSKALGLKFIRKILYR